MKLPPIRFWIATMVFGTTFTNYMLRSNMAVSLIGMMEKRAKNFTPVCKRDEAPKPKKEGNATTTTPAPPKYEKYDWTETDAGQILGGYFYGYLATVIFGGILSEMFGPWHVILWSSVLGGVFTALTPLSAKVGAVGVIVARVFTGFAGGVGYPAVNVLIAKWAPPKEKGKFLAAMMGNTIGSVVSLNLVGWTTTAFGWPWGFYSLTILMGVFCLSFAFLVSDTPQTHRWISEEEKNYIIESQQGTVSTKKKVAPYMKIFKSRPFWILVIAQFGNLWGLNIIVTVVPKFMSDTLGFNLKASAGLTALPYIARMIFSSIFGVLGDWTIKKEIMTKSKSRKFFIIFSHFIPAACLMLMSVGGCNHAIAVTLLVLNQAFNGACVVSHLINPQDISPNFAGTVYGLMNFLGMTTGIFVPSISAAFNDYYNMELAASTINFGLGGAVFAICGLIFVLFSSAEVQPWNEIPDKPEQT